MSLIQAQLALEVKYFRADALPCLCPHTPNGVGRQLTAMSLPPPPRAPEVGTLRHPTQESGLFAEFNQMSLHMKALGNNQGS